MKKVPQYERKLARAHLTRRSFEQTMRKFDSPGTWHLLDPPWPGNAWTSEYEGGLTVSPERVKKLASEMEGTVWILYGDTPAIRKTFKGKGFYRYSMKSNSVIGAVRKDGARVTRNKLLITTRPIGKGAKGVRQLAGLGIPGRTSRLTRGGKFIAGGLAAATTFGFSRVITKLEKPTNTELIGEAISLSAVTFFARAFFISVLTGR